MAVIENRVTEEGDVLVIRPEVPVVGILALSQFVDTTTGESETDYFLKEFRYSVDGGLTFSEWEELSLINIQNAVITQQDAFVIEYRYTRVGNAPEVELEFNDILVSGEVSELPYPVYNKTAFKNFFNVNDINVFSWAINVLEKLYVKGLILPDFIERANNFSNLEDEDFIVYWNSITHIFAIIVNFSRKFEEFEFNSYLLNEFIDSKDLITSNELDITDLIYLFNNYVEEYKKRGTYAIIERKEDGAALDGELIRLTKSKVYQEFIFALLKNYETGWCLGKSSPTCNRTTFIDSLNKFNDLVDEEDVDDVDKVPVSSSQAYELSFKITSTNSNITLDFGVISWNKDDAPVTLKNSLTSGNTNYFFQNKALKFTNQEYYVRAIVYGFEAGDNESHVTSIGGNNLRFNETCAKVVPFLSVNNKISEDDVVIEGVILRPAYLPFSRGQLGVKNIVYLNCNNDSGEQNSHVENFISEKLIPYSCVLKTNFIS
jgi:hypothetical protein